MRLAVFAALALLAAPLSAQVQPRPVGGDPRIQVVDYDENQIVQLQAAPGYQLTVEFSPDEQIESVALGDGTAWQATPNRRGDHLFVKPLQASSTTNMTVVTSVRVYLFELVPASGAPYTVRFSYPGSGEGVEQAEAEQLQQGRYRLSGARALRPSRISDDGRHTYIEWPRDRAIPAVYALDAQGREGLVNGMMRDDIFVIDSIARRLVFRIDRATAHATRVEQRSR